MINSSVLRKSDDRISRFLSNCTGKIYAKVSFALERFSWLHRKGLKKMHNILVSFLVLKKEFDWSIYAHVLLFVSNLLRPNSLSCDLLDTALQMFSNGNISVHNLASVETLPRMTTAFAMSALPYLARRLWMSLETSTMVNMLFCSKDVDYWAFIWGSQWKLLVLLLFSELWRGGGDAWTIFDNNLYFLVCFLPCFHISLYFNLPKWGRI